MIWKELKLSRVERTPSNTEVSGSTPRFTRVARMTTPLDGDRDQSTALQ